MSTRWTPEQYQDYLKRQKKTDIAPTEIIKMAPDGDNGNTRRMVILDIESLYSVYLKTGSVHKTGEQFNVTGDTVHQHLLKAGKRLNNTRWKPSEVEQLTSAYRDPEGVNLAILANKIGRTYASIACKAEEIGLTSSRGNHTRTKEHTANHSGPDWSSNPHPKGMKGKKHTAEVKALISQKGMGRIVPPEQVDRMIKTKYARYGTVAPNVPRGSWKAAWREVGGKRFFARSRWEANYARYLEFLKVNGEISEWEHEPETFWFEAIRRGSRSYLPDFRVTNKDGSVEYHEVKGWMDSRSRTKIRRMAKYHPLVKLVVRDTKWFRSNGVKLAGIIPGWETNEKPVKPSVK